MPCKIIRNRSLYYQDIGQGFPILLGHGYLLDRNMWHPQVHFLSKHFRCIVPDLWSHGFSEEVPQRPYSFELLSEDYFHLMRALELKEYAVVGQSLGGVWATHLALNHPEVVKALVLMDTFVGEEPKEKKEAYFDMLASIEKNQRFGNDLIEQVVPYFLSEDTLAHHPELGSQFKTSIEKIPHERLAGLIELGYTFFSRGSLLKELHHLKMPCMITCGEFDLPRPQEESTQMASYLPHARLTIIPKAGHISNLEQPDYVNALLGSFFDEHHLAPELIPNPIALGIEKV